MKKLIIFDLDDTLYDTGKLKGKMFSLAASQGISRKQVVETYGGLKPFSLKEYAIKLFPEHRKQLNFKRRVKAMIAKGGFLFKGVRPMLKSLQKSHVLVLLTYGEVKNQFSKVKAEDLRKYFKQTIVCSKSLKSKEIEKLVRNYQLPTVFMDDVLQAVTEARELGIRTIKIKSGEKKQHYFSKLTQQILA